MHVGLGLRKIKYNLSSVNKYTNKVVRRLQVITQKYTETFKLSVKQHKHIQPFSMPE